MSGGKLIGNIAAAVLIFFGVLFIWSSFSAQGQPANLIIGIITAGIGLVIIFFTTRKPRQEPANNVTVKIDLPGNVAMDSLKCQSCGGTIGPDNVKMIAGAPVVTCPYCNTTYQLTEEPKW